jgi:predicted DNA-binding protein with PD1-like motif
MQARRMHEVEGLETWVIVMQTGDELVGQLKAFARDQGLDSASFKAIGAFERATLAFFDWERKAYCPIPVNEQVEVAALTGDIAIDTDGEPAVHVHAVLGRRDGSAMAGHLLEGLVRPTLEVVLTETPGRLKKQLDGASGLALIRLA